MINKEDAMRFLKASGQDITLERMAKTFLDSKTLSGGKDNKKVWDNCIHDILKACFNYEEVIAYINENGLDKTGTADATEAKEPKGYKEIKNVTGVYVSDKEIIVTGIPADEDENHNCDVLGCTSVSHVLFRASI